MMLRAALLVVGLSGTAIAGPKSNALALTSTSITGSGAELVKKVKRASAPAKAAVFHECDGAWTVNYAVALAVTIPSAELTLKITDVSGAERETVAVRRKFVYSDAAVARGVIKLDHDEVVSPNAKLLLEIESDGVAIAKQTFFIQGAARTAKPIVFSAEEAASGDEVAVDDVRSKRR